MIVTTCAAAKSIWSVVLLSSFSRVVMLCEVCCIFVLVESLPSRHRSTTIGINTKTTRLGDEEYERWMASRGWVCVCSLGDVRVDVSYLWQV